MASGWAADLLPVLVAGPVLVACVLVVLGAHLPRRVVDVVATGTALGVTAAATVVLLARPDDRTVTWLGEWQPVGGVSVGVPFVADSVSTGIAVLVGALTSCALLFSWRYFESVSGHLHVLVLFFLAGMEGFALSGDVFDMFVFFELMGVAAYALTGFKVEDETAVEAGLNFGIVNSLGAYLSLAGIGILYSRVGQLGLPQLGDALSTEPLDALTVVSFVLIVTSFLVKAALVPFHFWLADAHAAAPAPVCVLFSGVMVELGLYGTARVFWVVYGDRLPLADISRAFLVLGVVTALLGALMCVTQRHLKRLLAFSTIAHIGLFTIGFATLGPDGTGGAMLYVVGHAGVKSALFLIAGVLLNRYQSVDEMELHGCGRGERLMPVLFLAAALGLAGLPPFGTGLGKSITEDAASLAGHPWAPALFVLVSAVTAGAVLRAGARIYLGWGSRSERRTGDVTTGEEEPETRPLSRIPATMTAAVVVLVVGGFLPGVLPGAGAALAHAAERLIDGDGYIAHALTGAPSVPLQPAPHAAWTSLGVGLGLLSTVLALGFAALGLWWRRIPWRSAVERLPVGGTMHALHRLHSGHVGDYVAWLFVGVAVLGALVGLPQL